ncbi:MAG: hypothetical protein ACW98I_08825 [Candidatus Hodarchaeales archaeon]
MTTSQIFSTKLVFVLFLILIVFFTPASVEARQTSYNVNSGDQWTYKILAAKRSFSYSFGLFGAEITTRGYNLGEEIMPVGSSLNLSVVTVNEEEPVNIVYQLISNESVINIESNESQLILALQNSLGLSILGNETNFFDNSTGVSAGEEFFAIPTSLSWSALFNVWNQSIPELDGAIDGIETILYLDYEETPKTFFMVLEFSGTMNDESTGIVLDFVYAAEFKWEKKNGILLFYDINSDMEGTINNSNSAGFSIDIRVEREEEISHISSIEILAIFIALVALHRKRKK